MRLVLASSNVGKLAEFRTLLAGTGLDAVPQTDFGVADADETGLTFIENALLKARHASAATGLPALADDSGICVDALDGAPGLYSARYAGDHGNSAANIAKLLDALRDVPVARRTAHFHCVLALVRRPDDPAPIVCEGVWRGSILDAPRGQHGFGYDPVFLDPLLGQSGAEIDPATKHRVSHRGQAMHALRQRLSAGMPGY